MKKLTEYTSIAIDDDGDVYLERRDEGRSPTIKIYLNTEAVQNLISFLREHGLVHEV